MRRTFFVDIESGKLISQIKRTDEPTLEIIDPDNDAEIRRGVVVTKVVLSE